jgi:hypothetical protein
MSVAQQYDFDSYRRSLAERARDAGLQSVGQSDPDLLDEAVAVIRELAHSGDLFSADHVRARLPAGSSKALGAAFRKAAQEGIIMPAGVTVSDAVSRRRGLQWQWVGASDVSTE